MTCEYCGAPTGYVDGIKLERAHECKRDAMKRARDLENTIEKLRGQLQNCVNHLELLKRHAYRKDEEKLNKCIDSANRALYGTLST